MYVQMIKQLRENYEKKMTTNAIENQNENAMSMSILSNSFEIYSSQFDYDQLQENIELSVKEYTDFKSNLEEDKLELLENIENRLNKINELKIDLIEAKHKDNLNLNLASQKYVFEKVNLSSIKFYNEEFETKLDKIKSDLDTKNKLLIDNLKEDYERRLNEYEEKIEELIPNENDLEQLKKLIKEKDDQIESLRQSEDIYVKEIISLKNRLNLAANQMNEHAKSDHNQSFLSQSVNLITLESTTDNEHSNESMDSNEDDSTCLKEQYITTNSITEMPITDETSSDSLSDHSRELNPKTAQSKDDTFDYKMMYEELKQAVENMEHPLFSNLMEKHQKEFDELKRSYEKKVEDEINAHKNHIIELEKKQKLELERLERDFGQVLNADLDDLKKELEKTSRNQGIGIKFRYISEHRHSEISDSDDLNLLFDKTINLNEENLANFPSNLTKTTTTTKTTTKNISVTTNLNESECESDLVVEQMPINQSSDGTSSNSTILSNDDKTMFDKIIEIETEDGYDEHINDYVINSVNHVRSPYEHKIIKDNKESNGDVMTTNKSLIDLKKHEKIIVELQDKIKELEAKNKKLQETLETYYEKDDVFMACSRRENEERDNFIRLLQVDLDKLTNQTSALHLKNQNLINLLSKVSLITTSIEDHINRRFNRILSNNNLMVPALKSLKNSASSSAESGLTASETNDADSNDDLSDDGLDYSQKFCDNLTSNELTDDAIIETNIKLQTAIDKVLNKLEEVSSQLSESQNQYFAKLDENQRVLSEYKTKLINIENDYRDELNELHEKINNYEGLLNAYDLDKQTQLQKITSLERNLTETTSMLETAKTQIQSEKVELSNLETIRKDLEAQRSLFTEEIQDSDVKDLENSPPELIKQNSFLLEEKHELEYKLNKTNEITQQQIKDLEDTNEHLNNQIKQIKDQYEEQIFDLQKQMEQMDNQIKSGKAFLESQTSEREQEREEYEFKIKELKQLLSKKSTEFLENEDSIMNRTNELKMQLEEKTDRVNQLSLMNEQLERLNQEKEQMNVQLSNTLKDLEQNLDLHENQKRDNEKKIELLKEEIDTLLNTNKSQGDEINDLREKLNDALTQVKTQSDSINNWNIEKEDLIQEKNNLQSELTSYMNKLSDLKIHKENIEIDFNNQLSALENKLALSNNQNDEKDQQIENLQKKLNEYNEDFEHKLEAEMNQLKLIHETNELTLRNTYEAQIEQLKLNIDFIKNELVEKEKLMEMEKTSLNDVTQNLLETKNEQIDELNDQLVQEREKLDRLERTLKELELRSVENLEKSKTHNELKLVELGQQIEQLKTQADDLRNEYELKLENLANEHGAQLERLNDEKETVNTQYEQLKLDLVKSNQTNEQLTNDNEQLNAKLNALDEELSSLKDDLNSKNDVLTEKEELITRLNAEMAQLQESLSLVEHELSARKENAENLQQQLAEAVEHEQELRDANEKASVERASLKQHIAQMEEQTQRLQQQIDELKSNNDHLSSQLADELTNTADIKQNMQHIETLLAESNSKLQYFEQQNRELNEELDQLKATISEQNNKVIVDFETQTEEEQPRMPAVDRSEEELNNLKAMYTNQLEKLKIEMELKFRNDLDTMRNDYETKLAELRETYDRDEVDSEKSLTIDATIPSDNFRKLKEQIELSKELDNDILTKMNQKLLESRKSDDIPSEIKDILEKLDNEGISLLTLSEILKLKTHLIINNTPANSDLTTRLSNMTNQNEKDQLTEEVYKLRELLSEIKKINSVSSGAEENGWRAAILRAISEIFLSQKECLLAELRTFINNNGFQDPLEYIKFLENKLDNLTDLNQKSMDYLVSVDRESFMKEITSLRAEIAKLSADLNSLQDNERELKRELKLMEYAKDAETIKSNDFKQALTLEKNKYLDLMDKYNQEKKKTSLMSDQLCEFKEEVIKIKKHLDQETEHLNTICKELDAERVKNEQLSSLLEKKSRTIENEENEFQKEIQEQVKKMYLKNVNSDDSYKTNGNPSIIDNQIAELRKHANNLHNLLTNEKSKNEKLTKAYNELKNNYLKYTNAETMNSNNNLERIRQSLEYLALIHRDKLESTNLKHQTYLGELKTNLNDIINELENISFNSSMTNGNGLHSYQVQQQHQQQLAHGYNNDLETKTIAQNKELIREIKKLTNDKIELRNVIAKLEEELWTSKNKAKSEHATLSEHDKEKFKKLYYKYLRAESFRKSLVYQKRFLLIMLNGYEETEKEILATLRLENNNKPSNEMNGHGASNGKKHSMQHHQLQQVQHSNNHELYTRNNNATSSSSSFYLSGRFLLNRAKNHRFRTYVICVIAISRIKYLQRKHSHIINRN